MIVSKGQTKSLTIRNVTTNGILVTVYLAAAAANTAITPATFTRNEVNLKVELKRNKTNQAVMNDNLQVLGLYNAKNYGLRDWIAGNKMNIAAAGVVEDMILNVFIQYGGHINLKGEDELVVQMKCGTNAFGVAYSQANSYIEFDANRSVGYEDGVPVTSATVVQANITNEKYYPGDHCAKIMFLNFDKDNITNQVINTCNISSDRFDMSMNFYSMWNRDRNVLLPARMEERFTTAAYDPAAFVFGYQQAYPQTVCLFSSVDGDSTINNVAIDISYQSAQVAASQNYVVSTCFIISQNSVARKLRREMKHNLENFNSLPSSVAIADGGDVGGAPAGISIAEVKVK